MTNDLTLKLCFQNGRLWFFFSMQEQLSYKYFHEVMHCENCEPIYTFKFEKVNLDVNYFHGLVYCIVISEVMGCCGRCQFELILCLLKKSF